MLLASIPIAIWIRSRAEQKREDIQVRDVHEALLGDGVTA
jgi:hypothetical protein